MWRLFLFMDSHCLILRVMDYVSKTWRKLVIKGLSRYRCKKSKYQNITILLLWSLKVQWWNLRLSAHSSFPSVQSSESAVRMPHPCIQNTMCKKGCTTGLYWLNCSRNKIYIWNPVIINLFAIIIIVVLNNSGRPY